MSRRCSNLGYQIDFNDSLNQLIIGSLLGDGMLKKNSGSKEYTLRFHHSIEQLQYVEYKRSILDSYELTTNGGNRGLYFGHYYMKNSGRWYDDVEYMSRTHPVFSYWESLTYEHVAGRRRVKHLCKEMLDNLGPEALAIWFCDDGSLNAYKRTKSYGRPDRDMFGYGMNMFIHAESFTVHEQGLLIGVLKDRYGIDGYVYKEAYSPLQTRDLTLIRILEDGARRLADVIDPYVPDSMRYKIDPATNLERQLVAKELIPVETVY